VHSVDIETRMRHLFDRTRKVSIVCITIRSVFVAKMLVCTTFTLSVGKCSRQSSKDAILSHSGRDLSPHARTSIPTTSTLGQGVAFAYITQRWSHALTISELHECVTLRPPLRTSHKVACRSGCREFTRSDNRGVGRLSQAASV
jgi:hypothetical protein